MVRDKLMLEIVWWIATVLIVVIIMLPIYGNIGEDYPFYTANIIMIVVFVTFTRYIFLLKYTVLAWNTKAKALLVFLPIPFFFYFMDAMYDFQRYLDEEGLTSLMNAMQPDNAVALARYIQYQKIFFAAGAIITLIWFPLRMIISIWRNKNRGTV